MNFFKSLKNLVSFFKIPKSKREIVFYAENENSYLFFEGLIKKLISQYKLDIHYVTSSISDPILKCNNENFKTYFIGSETIKTIYFKMFDSKIMVLTMPELNIYHLKRSSHQVKYIFIPHNILSLHMTYKSKAFNHYDIIFCSDRGGMTRYSFLISLNEIVCLTPCPNDFIYSTSNFLNRYL